MGKILQRESIEVSPWVSLVRKEVQLEHRSSIDTYHFVKQADYVGIFAVREDGMIPLVRQYRPCVEAFTLEFPAGTVDDGESPETAARRELAEEVGLLPGTLHAFPVQYPDTGRLALRSTAFFAKNCTTLANFREEPGVEVCYFSADELREALCDGRFCHQLHVAIIGLATVMGHFSF